jgi:hypothetical protein
MSATRKMKQLLALFALFIFGLMLIPEETI